MLDAYVNLSNAEIISCVSAISVPRKEMDLGISIVIRGFQLSNLEIPHRSV